LSRKYSQVKFEHAILDHPDRNVKTVLELRWIKFGRNSITWHERISHRVIRRARTPVALAFGYDREREMENHRRKQQIVRQYPKPVSDIKRRKESRKASSQVEIGEGIVREFREPNLSC
jgi:hypothetical protein